MATSYLDIDYHLPLGSDKYLKSGFSNVDLNFLFSVHMTWIVTEQLDPLSFMFFQREALMDGDSELET